jgi:hypothetical protein
MLVPPPQPIKEHVTLTNPLFTRVVAPMQSKLLSDIYWLKNSYSEMTSKSIDTQAFYHFYDDLLLLDPHFIVPTRYGATYLSSMRNAQHLSDQLLNHAYDYNHQIELIQMALLMHIAYAKQLDNSLIKNWLSTLGKSYAPNPKLINAILYARKNQDTHFLKEDLLWLRKNSNNLAYIAEIDAALAKLP